VIPLVTASEQGKAQAWNPGQVAFFDPVLEKVKTRPSGIVASWHTQGSVESQRFKVTWKGANIEGEIPVKNRLIKGDEYNKPLKNPERGLVVTESGCLRVQPESIQGGILHPRLNTRWETDSKQVPQGKDAKNSE